MHIIRIPTDVCVRLAHRAFTHDPNAKIRDVAFDLSDDGLQFLLSLQLADGATFEETFPTEDGSAPTLDFVAEHVTRGMAHLVITGALAFMPQLAQDLRSDAIELED